MTDQDGGHSEWLMLVQNVGRVKGRVEGSIPTLQCAMDGLTCVNELEVDRPYS